MELWVRNGWMNFAEKWRLPCHFLGSFTCSKSTTLNQWLYFPSKGRHAEDFFVRKIRRLQPGLNPQTWVPKARTLPPDHRSRLHHNIWHIVHRNGTLCLYRMKDSAKLTVDNPQSCLLWKTASCLSSHRWVRRVLPPSYYGSATLYAEFWPSQLIRSIIFYLPIWDF